MLLCWPRSGGVTMRFCCFRRHAPLTISGICGIGALALFAAIPISGCFRGDEAVGPRLPKDFQGVWDAGQDPDLVVDSDSFHFAAIVMDRTKLVASLPVAASSNREGWFLQLDSGDTVPYGARLSFVWATVDCTRVIQDFVWRFAGQSAITTRECATTQPLFLTTHAVAGEPIVVEGRDGQGAVVCTADTVRIDVNFQPAVEFTATPHTVWVGSPGEFRFRGSDRDGDPDSLWYEWKFSTQATYQGPVQPLPDSLFILGEFTSQCVGLRYLVIRCFDSGGFARLSAPDTAFFVVATPPGNR